MKGCGVRLTAVRAQSPAARAGLRTGDRVLSIDGQPMADAIDVMYAIAEEVFSLEVMRGTRQHILVVERPHGRDWGVQMEPPPLRHCGNRCIFCFVDQMPRGLRPSLYIKDEDYRHSFLYGNYVTLSNTSQRDLDRIQQLRLSPLYISVHATDERVRQTLLGRTRVPPILPQLKQLANAGIVLHTQAVICPGVNDGRVLEKTVRDLSRLAPQVHSLAIVPVGLSQHRAGLSQLNPVTGLFAQTMVRKIAIWQARYQKSAGTRFVYATDEWYLRAGAAIPTATAYEGFPQIENGVGIVRQFIDGVRAASRKLPKRVAPARHLVVPTGTLAADIVRRTLKPLARIPGITLEVIPVPNRLFGPSVTVTGLLCGADIAHALAHKIQKSSRVMISGDMLRSGQDVFLDNMSLKALSQQLHAKVFLIESPATLVKTILAK